MPKKAEPLKDLHVRRLEQPGRHAVGGVEGLAINIEGPNSKQWVLRVTVNGKRRQIGLGGYPTVSLEQAREKARTMRAQAALGLDPALERRRAIATNAARTSLAKTFAEVAIECHELKSAEFKNKKHADQWINTLKTYAFPVLGPMYVDQIESRHVIEALKPIWKTKTETASRLRGRIQRVLSHAKAQGYRTGENPALWVDNLEESLAKPRKVTPVKHRPALPVAQLPRFMAALSHREGVAARALELTVLTAARVSEVRFAKASEFNLKEKVWTVPAERMKAKLPHRVPLSPRAIEILMATGQLKSGGLVFPGDTKTGALSENTQNDVIKQLHEEDIANGGPGFFDPVRNRIATAHGMRSTFKDWARTRTSFPDDASELALAHVNNDGTRAAYARDELLEIRAKMMELWSLFCLGTKEDNVVSLVNRKL